MCIRDRLVFLVNTASKRDQKPTPADTANQIKAVAPTKMSAMRGNNVVEISVINQNLAPIVREYSGVIGRVRTSDFLRQ